MTSVVSKLNTIINTEVKQLINTNNQQTLRIKLLLDLISKQTNGIRLRKLVKKNKIDLIFLKIKWNLLTQLTIMNLIILIHP